MSTKFLNEPIWSRRACVELREPVRSRGIEPDCVRQNKANSSFLYPCIPASLPSCFPPNEPNLKPGSWPLATFSLFTFLLFVNRMGYLYNFLQSRKRYYSSSIRVEPGGGKENRTEQ